MGGVGSGKTRRINDKLVLEFLNTHSVEEVCAEFHTTKQTISNVRKRNGVLARNSKRYWLSAVPKKFRNDQRLRELFAARNCFMANIARLESGEFPLVADLGIDDYKRFAEHVSQLIAERLRELESAT